MAASEKKEESFFDALVKLLSAPGAALKSAAGGGAPAPAPPPTANSGWQDTSYVRDSVERAMRAKQAQEAAEGVKKKKDPLADALGKKK